MANQQKKTSIGGQALIEGILMRGPRKTAIVVRRTDGGMTEKVEDIGTKTHGRLARLPLVRGVVSFWDSMKYGVGALNFSASFFEDEEDYEPGRFEKWLTEKVGSKKLESMMMTVAVVLGIAMPVALFFLLPTLISGFFGEGLPGIVRNLIEGCVRMVIFFLFIYLTSKQKDVHRTYMYHGAEHKTHRLLRGRAAADSGKRPHPDPLPSAMRDQLFVCRHDRRNFVYSAVRLGGQPAAAHGAASGAAAGHCRVSYEINRYAGRYDNVLTRVLRAPGLFMQRFTTFEPDDSMLEVAIAAMNHVIPENEQEDRW